VKAEIIVAAMLVFTLSAFHQCKAQPKKASPSLSSSFTELSEAAAKARDANQDDDAIQLYQKALVLKPDWQEGLWYLGTLLYEKEYYAGARDVLRRFVAFDPNAGPAWGLLGMSEYQTREYARSLDHLQRALSTGMGERKEMIQSVRYFVAILLTRAEHYDESLTFMFRMIVSGDATFAVGNSCRSSRVGAPGRRRRVRIANT
jgi:tetratricopeptide (TPR) repeat protein